MPTIAEIIAAASPSPKPPTPMRISQINSPSPPAPPAAIVTPQPYGKSRRWWAVICPHCRKLHVHGDLPPGLYSKREAPCYGPSYWIAPSTTTDPK